MTTTHPKFQLSTLSMALLLALANTQASAEEPTKEQLTRPESFVSFGLGHWTGDHPQMGIFDGMRDDGTYILFDANLVSRDDETGTWKSLTTRNLGLNNREIRAEYQVQGTHGGFIEYNQLSRENPYTINTGLTGIGTTALTENTVVPGAGNNVHLGTQRDKVTMGFFKNFMPGLTLNVSFKNEEKEGTRQWGRGSAPEFAVEPISSTTRILEAILNYSSEKWQLSGGYIGSWFENDNSLVTLFQATPVTAVNTVSAPNPTPLSLPLSNQAHQLFIDGGYNITPTTRTTFKMSYTRATQDEFLPTWSLAAPNAPGAGVPNHLNGEINTTLIQWGLTARPLANLSVLANLRYYDQQDDTPLALYVTGGGGVHNTPHSFSTTSGKLEATYRLPMNFSLTAGADLSRQDRSAPLFAAERYVPFRTSLDEDTYRLQLRRSLSDTVNGTLSYLHSSRDGSAYVPANAAGENEINPLHIADRDRNKWRAMVDWAPRESLSFQFVYEDAKDDYGYTAAAPYGIRDGSARLYSVDANYAVSKDWQITGWYSRDDTKAREFNNRPGSAANMDIDWEANLRDIGDAVGLGLRGRVNPKLKIGADLQWTRTHSQYPQTFTNTGATVGTTTYLAGTSGPLPDIHNYMTTLRLFAEYALQKNADLRVDLVHERWRTDDWTWLMANGTTWAYGSTTDGTTVIADPKQSATFLGVRYIYKFQ